jgi:hypothetical protein
MSDPAFQLCRNPRCRSRMPPAMGEHSQFCTRGCWEQFRRKRCVVCEREFEKKASNQHVCTRKACRAALRHNPEMYRPFHLGHLRGSKSGPGYQGSGGITGALENPHFTGIPEAEIAGATLDPIIPNLKGRRWVSIGGNDWELRDASGRMVARIREEGGQYWVARPRMIPEPPLETRMQAMRRGELFMMMSAPCGRTAKLSASEIEAIKASIARDEKTRLQSGTRFRSADAGPIVPGVREARGSEQSEGLAVPEGVS